jgi:hypothetical protein
MLLVVGLAWNILVSIVLVVVGSIQFNSIQFNSCKACPAACGFVDHSFCCVIKLGFCISVYNDSKAKSRSSQFSLFVYLNNKTFLIPTTHTTGITRDGASPKDTPKKDSVRKR